MKKLVIAALLTVLPVIMFAQEKKGPEFSWKGELRTRYNSQTAVGSDFNFFLKDSNVGDRFDSRFRLYTTAKMSSQLSAVWGLEIGDFQWGAGTRSSDMVNVETKHLYMDFNPDFAEGLKFRVGLQGIKDPFQSAIFDEDAPGIVVMPKIENFDLSFGMLVFQDDDVRKNLSFSTSAGVSATSGTEPAAQNIYFAQGIYKGKSYNVKGAFYYDFTSKANKGTHDIANLYFGAGFDMKATENMTFGGHFIMNSYNKKEGYTVSPGVFEDYKRSGSFIYAFGEYKQDKFNAKVHFGYTPGIDMSTEEDNPTRKGYYGIVEYASAYGLEFLYSGTTYDSTGVFKANYGGDLGQMVLALNLSYDWMFANFGLVNATYTMPDELDYGKGLATEIDFGVKTTLTKGLEFRAVYAIVTAGSLIKDSFEAIDKETATASELSANFTYKF